MSNPVIVRLRGERQRQVDFIAQLLEQVDEAQRDLVESETANLNAAKERVARIDEQLQPLEEFEAVRSAHEQTASSVAPTVPQRSAQGGGSRLSVSPREVVYPTPGHFIVDKIRSQRHYGSAGEEYEPDRDAYQRVMASRGMQTRAEGDVAPGVHQTTADTPGLLPTTIQGQVEEQLDGVRPFLTAIGIKPLAGIPGKTFHRPHVTQHTKVAKQTAEKAELASRDLKVEGLPFTKETAGGTLNISRQDIDWTSPAAWNIILNDLMAEYAEETDALASIAFEGGVDQELQVDPTDVDNLVKGLYRAAVIVSTKNETVRSSARRLPDTIFTSVDMWSVLGATLDIAAINKPGMRAGDADAGTFAGSILRFPRIMVPGLPAESIIVGRKSQFEFYEERIGLLSAVQPKVLGVEIAYGGYMAAGFLDATAFCRLLMV